MQRDIRDLADRGEPVALMEPILIGEASILRPILTDLATSACGLQALPWTAAHRGGNLVPYDNMP